MSLLQILAIIGNVLPIVEKGWQYFVNKSAQKQVSSNSPDKT